MRGSRRRGAEVKVGYGQRLQSISSESRHVADAERVSRVWRIGLKVGGNGEEDVRNVVGCLSIQDQHERSGGAGSVTLSV